MKEKSKGPNRTTLGIAVLVILAVGVFLLRGRIHFDWGTFVNQLRLADWKLFGVGVLLIWGGYVIRAVRWAALLRPTKRVSGVSLLGTQVIGFTAVALFGRLADLVRPYLVARRTNIPLTAQVAVYTVERMFDMGSVALIFALVLLFAPDRHTLPHADRINHTALLALAVVIVFVGFAVFVRAAGKQVAELMGRSVGSLSPKLGASVREKILVFREGLNAINSFGGFVQALVLSLVMWMMIAYSYLETLRAFTASAELAHMTLSRCMLLMATSTAGSLIQLPIIGWFTQIGIVAKAMQSFFNVAPEPALGAAAMLLVVTFMSIIPVGLVWSRFEHVSLKKLTEESETAAETLDQPVKPEFVPEA
ncbi:lysylphosphatidylglycerol synthase transmembrane domain-containing protein [Acidipila sp. EB88]|uniref:lysylphosphatidylglycerol synthase transmembrane domain-containing protein n=1 Tax=Acidipila sp. EB88 TaxID=2305226 RepID=UPI000F5F315E|nr:lysylphosphatidylglycerol synthase transmembrane domain-containing protein [Acidipila sp. EB88]RRA48816.1 UPF0104 family protein [Acidipila sp. EB88]